MIKTLDINSWDRFNKEDEFELTHFETCMGPVTKDYDFVIEEGVKFSVSMGKILL